MASITVRVQPLTDQLRKRGESTRDRTAALDDAMAIKRSINASLCHKADAVASLIGVSPQMLRSAASEDTATQLPIRRLGAFIRNAPDPMPLLETICAFAGVLPVRLPRAEARPLADPVREFGELMIADSLAREDGSYSPEDVVRIRREALQAVEAICGYMEYVARAAVRTGEGGV